MFGQPTPSATAIRPALLSDMQLDFRHSYETLFLLVELSDAMKQSVVLFSAKKGDAASSVPRSIFVSD